MKLSRLYTNKPEKFTPIEFNDGLNVIYGEIRLPENRAKDTHNLGKSTLGRVLDFSLLAKRNPKSFLFKHFDKFKEFTFYLEIKLEKSQYLTIKRSVKNSSKVSFLKHSEKWQNYSDLDDPNWDHLNVTFDKAKKLLDGILDLEGIKPWTFRNGINYFLRSQDDYGDVFRLRKFAGKDAQWKPYLAHSLGFNAELIASQYEIEVELEKKENAAALIKKDLGAQFDDLNKLDGILLIKRRDLNKKQTLVDDFDFSDHDKEITTKIIENIDTQISELNSERYSKLFNLRRVKQAIEEDNIIFNPDEAESIFKEAGILFNGQIKKDFTQLIDFNRAITKERSTYLKEEKLALENDLGLINKAITSLNNERSKSLSFLSNTEIFSKYKQASNELVSLKADIEFLERQKELFDSLKALNKEIRKLNDQHDSIKIQIDEDIASKSSDDSSLYSNIRVFFSEIVHDVINRNALINAGLNNVDHIDFKAEILNDSGVATSEDSGFTYKKLLCIAFDLAILRSHLTCKFPRFVFHDGIFESLDNRKKENLLSVIRQYSELGVQSIITVISSDLPETAEGESPIFSPTEIVCQLHDEGPNGRLFKMSAW
ncbi:DUF2326 domain-containing protein [Spongiibacter sp. KMU-166]|uniref:DUF2326 domain-containing protein n=1 Tax=Spongiibacter thalassae TaxID=2721624 RepID=A0ABX1GJP0_9GAMM|nr:DUF2326 domain-containing protein [Spongiibacter thalassae]NKI19126.1 DUF2326 domain-containing protein [Spongiibacter thalassae]